LVGQGWSYPEIGRALKIPAGQAYLIATGMPADGGETYTEAERQRPGVLATAQHLLGPSATNPTTKQSVLDWVKRRAGEDRAMQAAAAAREASTPSPGTPDA
jgi:hypothetical protein